MTHLTQPPHRNKPSFSKCQKRWVVWLLLGTIFIILLFIIFLFHQKTKITSARTQAPTFYYGKPDINLVLSTLSITPTAPATQVSSQTYYVSPGGDDANDGTIDFPWKTLKKATSNLIAGDILYIRGGLYQERLVVNHDSGTAINPIIISGYEDEEVIIDGMNNTFPGKGTGSPLVWIVNDWVIVKNLTIQYSGDMGIVAMGSNVSLDHLYIHHNWSSGAILTGDYDLIQNSQIWYNSTNNENGQSPTSWGCGVSCGRYPDYCTIRHNIVWDNWGEGISTGEALHTNIENNVSFDNQQNFYILDTKFSILQGNLSYCSTGNPIDSYETQNGILVGDEKGVPIPLGAHGTRFTSSDNTIINNIVIGCNHNLEASIGVSTNNLYAFNVFINSAGSTREPYNILFTRGSAINGRFINNIIIQDDKRPVGISSGSGITFSHNLWSKVPPSNMKGDGDIVGDPLFIKQGLPYSAEWFELMYSSPARNAALPLSEVTLDFLGNPRDTDPDIGAIEFISR